MVTNRTIVSTACFILFASVFGALVSHYAGSGNAPAAEGIVVLASNCH